jgi:hypothetical protein
MRFAFQMLIFMLGINLAFGIITATLPGFNGMAYLNAGPMADTHSIGINSDIMAQLNHDINGGSLNVTQGVTGSGYATSNIGLSGFFNSVLDSFGFGFITKLTTFIGSVMVSTLYGLPMMIDAICGPSMSAFVTALYIIISLGYFLTIVWLLTGRNVTKESL